MTVESEVGLLFIIIPFCVAIYVLLMILMKDINDRYYNDKLNYDLTRGHLKQKRYIR